MAQKEESGSRSAGNPSATTPLESDRLFQEALSAQEAGDLKGANRVYRQILASDQGHAESWHMLGGIAYQEGDLREAAERISRAVSLGPDNPAYRSNLALALISLGRFREAAESCRRALALAPEMADAHNNLGNALRCLNRLDEAIQCLESAVRIEPRFAEAHLNLGLTLYAKSRAAAAAESYRRALEINPNLFEAHFHLGEVHFQMGRVEEAEASCRRALACRPSDGVRVRLALLLPIIYRSIEEMRSWRKGLEEKIDGLLSKKIQVSNYLQEIGTTNYYLVYQGLDDREIQEKIARLYAASRKTYALKKEPSEKVRIGFISKHFRNHTIGKYMRGIIARLSRERFSVTVLSIGEYDDEISRFIQKSADAFVQVPDHLETARDMIAGLSLDALFYTDIGMESWSYFLAQSRLAPVQCVTWGHPVTTGIGTLDCFISSADLEPEGAEEHYTENLVRLGNISTYYYRPELPVRWKRREDIGLPADGRIYCCPQTLFKFHPEYDAILGEILRRDPERSLILIEGKYPSWNESLMGRFRKSIPDVAARLRFLPRLGQEDYFHLLALSDALLDPIHFTGGNSSFEGFAVGTPIVTLPSPFMRGRMTYALYRKMGILDCVAETPGEYAEIALRLGTDPPWRESIKKRILASSHLLFEDLSAVRELEDFLTGAVARARVKKSPGPA